MSAFGRNRLLGWAWIPASSLVLLGGYLVAIVPLYTLLVASRDEKFRVARALPTQPGCQDRIQWRLRRPLSFWVAAFALLMVGGGYMRWCRGVKMDLRGVRLLAHPAMIWINGCLMMLAAAADGWSARRTRKTS